MFRYFFFLSCVQSQYKSLLISERTTVDDLIELLLRCHSNNERIERFSIYEVKYNVSSHMVVNCRVFGEKSVATCSPLYTLLIYTMINILVLYFASFAKKRNLLLIDTLRLFYFCCAIGLQCTWLRTRTEIASRRLAAERASRLEDALRRRASSQQQFRHHAQRQQRQPPILLLVRAKAQSRQQRPDGQAKGKHIYIAILLFKRSKINFWHYLINVFFSFLLRNSFRGARAWTFLLARVLPLPVRRRTDRRRRSFRARPPTTTTRTTSISEMERR